MEIMGHLHLYSSYGNGRWLQASHIWSLETAFGIISRFDSLFLTKPVLEKKVIRNKEQI